jgi:hypothetical protein
MLHNAFDMRNRLRNLAKVMVIMLLTATGVACGAFQGGAPTMKTYSWNLSSSHTIADVDWDGKVVGDPQAYVTDRGPAIVSVVVPGGKRVDNFNARHIFLERVDKTSPDLRFIELQAPPLTSADARALAEKLARDFGSKDADASGWQAIVDADPHGPGRSGSLDRWGSNVELAPGVSAFVGIQYSYDDYRPWFVRVQIYWS